MKQPHSESDIQHTDDQQNTGNHRVADGKGADALGGTRGGAENVEPGHDKSHSIESGTDVDRVPSLDGSDPGTKTTASRERSPERDEFGRL